MQFKSPMAGLLAFCLSLVFLGLLNACSPENVASPQSAAEDNSALNVPKGMYITSPGVGRWRFDFYAGPAGNLTTFEGDLISTVSPSFVRLRSESNDTLAVTSPGRLHFKNFITTNYDSFEVTYGSTQSVCLQPADISVAIYVGPLKQRITPPFNLATLQPCSGDEGIGGVGGGSAAGGGAGTGGGAAAGGGPAAGGGAGTGGAVCRPVFQTPASVEGPSFYRLATGQLSGTADSEIVGGGHDGTVCAFAANGDSLWGTKTPALPFDLDIAESAVAVAGANGMVYVLEGSDGKVRWQYNLSGPVYQVRFAKVGGTLVLLAGGTSETLTMFNANTGAVLGTYTGLTGAVIRLRVGNIDGDAEPELFVLTRQKSWGDYVVSIFDIKPSAASVFGILVAPSAGKKLPGKVWDFQLADIDADGRCELVSNERIYRFANDLTLTIVAELNDVTLNPTYDFSYRMGMVEVGNFTAAPGLEIAVLSGPDLSLYKHDGTAIGAPVRAPQGFTHLVAQEKTSPSSTTSLILGSAPNDDNQLYKLDLSTDAWRSAYDATPRVGRIKAIAANNVSLNTDVKNRPATSPTPLNGQPGPYVIAINHRILETKTQSVQALTNAINDVKAYRDAPEFANENLKFAAVIWTMEQGNYFRPDGTLWDRDTRWTHGLLSEDIRAAARTLANADAPFYIQVGHGCDPHLKVETALSACNENPNHCLGFVSAEDEGNAATVGYYLKNFIKPLLNGIVAMSRTAAQPKPQVILREKAAWWTMVTGTDEARTSLFPDGNPYKSIIVPSAEDSNSRTPDLQAASRVGLWRDGWVDRWASRMTADDFSFNRLWEWEYPMAGHPHLRYFAAQAALGASVFMVVVGEGLPASPSRVGKEGVIPFLHLLGRGVIAPPTVTQLVSAIPVGLRFTQPVAARFEKGANNGHVYSGFSTTELNTGAFTRNACYWGMSPTPATDLSKTLWGRTVQFGNFIPAAPGGGFVSVLPLPISTPSRWTRLWRTDGDAIFNPEGYPRTPAQAQVEMQADIDTALSALPFAISGRVFSTMSKINDNRFVITLIDPGYLDTEAPLVQITSNSTGTWNVTDRVTNQSLGQVGAGLAIQVPRGSLRVIDLVRP